MASPPSSPVASPQRKRTVATAAAAAAAAQANDTFEYKVMLVSGMCDDPDAEGIGLGLSKRGGIFRVDSLLPGMPAALCKKVQLDDALIAVNGISLRDGTMPMAEVTRMLQQPSVFLRLVRGLPEPRAGTEVDGGQETSGSETASMTVQVMREFELADDVVQSAAGTGAGVTGGVGSPDNAAAVASSAAASRRGSHFYDVNPLPTAGDVRRQVLATHTAQGRLVGMRVRTGEEAELEDAAAAAAAKAEADEEAKRRAMSPARFDAATGEPLNEAANNILARRMTAMIDTAPEMAAEREKTKAAEARAEAAAEAALKASAVAEEAAAAAAATQAAAAAAPPPTIEAALAAAGGNALQASGRKLRKKSTLLVSEVTPAEVAESFAGNMANSSTGYANLSKPAEEPAIVNNNVGDRAQTGVRKVRKKKTKSAVAENRKEATALSDAVVTASTSANNTPVDKLIDGDENKEDETKAKTKKRLIRKKSPKKQDDSKDGRHDVNDRAKTSKKTKPRKAPPQKQDPSEVRMMEGYDDTRGTIVKKVKSRKQRKRRPSKGRETDVEAGDAPNDIEESEAVKKSGTEHKPEHPARPLWQPSSGSVLNMQAAFSQMADAAGTVAIDKVDSALQQCLAPYADARGRDIDDTEHLGHAESERAQEAKDVLQAVMQEYNIIGVERKPGGGARISMEEFGVVFAVMEQKVAAAPHVASKGSDGGESKAALQSA